MKKAAVAALCAVLVAAGAASAGGVDRAHVSAKAKWVVHLDVAGLLGSGLGEHLLKRLAEPDAAAKLNGFVRLFNFDPTRDLSAITLYGESYDPAGGVAIIKAQVDRERLMTLLEVNEGREVSQYGKHELYRWFQKPEGKGDDGVRWGAFHGEDLVVIGREKKVLQEALDVLDGKADSLAKVRTATVLPAALRGSFFQVAGEGFSVPKGAEPKAAVLRKLAALAMDVGEVRGELFIDIVLTAKAEKDAQQVRDILRGMLALANLAQEQAAEQGKPVGPWAPVLKGMEVGGRGTGVELHAAAAMKDVTALLIHLAEQRQAGAAGKMPARD